MIRPAVLWAACAVAFVAGGGTAGAAPPGPAPPPPPCSFSLSAPVRDGDVVTVTVESTTCAPLAAPYSAVACLQAAGSAVRCEQARGSDPARVSVPYAAGTLFVATGRGCAGWAGLPPAPDCQLLGPETAAL